MELDVDIIIIATGPRPNYDIYSGAALARFARKSNQLAMTGKLISNDDGQQGVVKREKTTGLTTSFSDTRGQTQQRILVGRRDASPFSQVDAKKLKETNIFLIGTSGGNFFKRNWIVDDF